MLQKSKASGKLFKWVIELGQIDVNFHPKMVIKGQALCDFITEFTYTSVAEVAGTTDMAEAVKVVEAEHKRTLNSHKRTHNSGTPM